MGGRSGPAVPPTEAGCTCKAAAKRRTWGLPQVAARRGGTRGSDAHPASSSAGGKRHRANGAMPACGAQLRPRYGIVTRMDRDVGTATRRREAP